jgi:PAS domain S-box-containing protein
MLELLVVGAWSCLVPYSVWFFLSAKKREREGVEVQERFSGLYNSSKDAIKFAGFDGMFLDANDSFCKLTGYSRNEILTKKYQDITAKEYEEYEAKQIERMLRTGEPQEYEKEYVRKDGSRVPVLLTTFIVKGANGKPVGTAAIIKDITERKKAEEALRETRDYLDNLLNYANAPIIVWNLEFKITKFNHAFERLTGFSSNDVVGKNLDILFPKDKKEEAMAYIQRALAGEYWQTVEIPILHKDGTVRTFLWNSASIYDSTNQKIVAIIAQGQDVTKQKRLQEELVKSEKLAAIGQLASAVGHEIRNPLGVINNSSYFLNKKLKDTADEIIMKHLKIIERKINSANLIVSDLLDFARKKPPTLEQTALNDIVMNALSNIPILENIKVITKLGEIPPMLLDQEQITRVFQNMILNAVQAMSEGGKLTIQTSKHDDPVEITFKDTGVGIPEENLPKLFTPLFSTKAKGIGLGLTICKQIVEGHGGDITVKSKVGEGTTFTVKLPIRAKEESSK